VDLTPDEVRLLRITHPYDEFLRHRLNTISELFARNGTSIDAVILAGTLLTALGFRRYCRRNNDQGNFESLLFEYWPAYVDRVSLPSIIRSLQRREHKEELILQIQRAFPSDATYGRIRQVADDPMRRSWETWCNENVTPGDRITSDHTYARILFRDFRNSVQHRLEIADGNEGFAMGFDRPFFYTPRGRGTTLGFVHRELGEVATQVVAGLREWAVSTGTDIFERGRV
jgi:hypothetical protein